MFISLDVTTIKNIFASNQRLSRTLMLGMVFTLASCSSMPDDDNQPEQAKTQANTSQYESANPNKPAHPLRVKTKEGVVELEPLVVSYEEEQDFKDPLEWLNRPIFNFNDFVYRNALVPISKGYMEYTPDLFREGVSNFFSNLDEPLNAINYAFQLEGKDSGRSLARFLINTTIGIFGLFDPATNWFEIEYKDTNLNQTLVSYEVDYGAFLVLPILGQTDLRNGFSTLAEGLAHPINFTTDNPDALYIQTYEKFHEIAPTAVNYPELRKQNDDPYIFFRNLYLQSVLRDQAYNKTVKERNREQAEQEQQQAE
ncbi:VacJ family lipoprotein [Catenovulum sp. 2E275]|uniref:MlaA family lipoprotein n=1 Tax=Catenovulum sp. 2E275 TaxID=2980497 RepID=UPI0021D3E997|nr:VacJ family lipoprotein [Catenovulum sp. 2E275]MCU4676846.1 VacJ family lipoprotein [Catenovulum sp. 2E275]